MDFKKVKVPHVFVLLTGVILVCSILSYFIPSGEFLREERQIGNLTRTVVIPNTFQELPKHISIKSLFIGEEREGYATPVSLIQFLSAIPRGMEQAADIIFFVFVIGGVFSVINRTGTIIAVIQTLLKRFSSSGIALTIVVIVAISIGGSTIGMGEELIPLVPFFLLLSKELGYDRIFGLALVYLSAEIGFAAATTNPFTVQIAQGIAEVPPGSGIGFRMIFYLVIITLTIIYVLRYGQRVKNDPEKSFMKGDDFSMDDYDIEEHTFNKRHLLIIIVSIVIFAGILYAVQNMGWWLAEMGGGFLLMGLAASIISKINIKETVSAFVRGMEDMIVAALVVGFAKGIQVVLMDARIMDSVIHFIAEGLQGAPKIAGAEGMLLFQSFLNFFIPSGSGQAAATMPLMAPLADVLGLSRQVAVFAFTCGDGFSNILIPTSGLLMAVLSIAKIPYERWLKFVLPLFLLLMAVSAIFLAIAVMIGF